jgi:hypothetical protein
MRERYVAEKRWKDIWMTEALRAKSRNEDLCRHLARAFDALRQIVNIASPGSGELAGLYLVGTPQIDAARLVLGEKIDLVRLSRWFERDKKVGP